jgi:hypothetical protein
VILQYRQTLLFKTAERQKGEEENEKESEEVADQETVRDCQDVQRGSFCGVLDIKERAGS